MAHCLPGGDWRRVCPAQGIEWVIVNGEPILHGGKVTGATPGAMIGVRGAEFDRDYLAGRQIAAE